MSKIRIKRGRASSIAGYPSLPGEIIFADDIGALIGADKDNSKVLLSPIITLPTLAERDDLPLIARRWHMIVGVYADPFPLKNGHYVLDYNLSDTDLANNANWRNLNKYVVAYENATSGQVLASAHRLQSGVVPVMYAAEEPKGDEQMIFQKVVINFKLDPATGDLLWSSKTNIYRGYLILV